MLTKTSTFCQIMPEKNQFKETYPLKKRKKTPKFVHFKNLYPLLLRLCRPQDVIPKLKKHKLANGPHLRSPQQCLEVSQDSYFRSNKLLLSDQRCERPCIIFDIYSGVYLTTETVPQVCCKNHSGLFLRLMLTTSKGTPLANSVNTVLWAQGQNLDIKQLNRL